MNDQNMQTIPYIAHESAMARNERHIKRLIFALVLTVVLLFASNCVWLVYLYQYDFGTETETYSVDLDTGEGGNANYIGQDGDIINGESEGNTD